MKSAAYLVVMGLGVVRQIYDASQQYTFFWLPNIRFFKCPKSTVRASKHYEIGRAKITYRPSVRRQENRPYVIDRPYVVDRPYVIDPLCPGILVPTDSPVFHSPQ